jgi:hypothetical protein
MVHSKYGPFQVWSVLGMVVLGLVVLGMFHSRYVPFWEWSVPGVVALGMVVLGLVVLGLVYKYWIFASTLGLALSTRLLLHMYRKIAETLIAYNFTDGQQSRPCLATHCRLVFQSSSARPAACLSRKEGLPLRRPPLPSEVPAVALKEISSVLSKIFVCLVNECIVVCVCIRVST